MSILSDGVRPSATLFVLFALIPTVLFRIFKHHFFGGIARAVSVLEIACFATFIFALCLPAYLYNVRAERYSELDGTTARVEMTVREVYSETEYYTSFVGKVRAVNLDGAEFGISVYAPFAAEIKAEDIIVFDATLTQVNGSEALASRAYYKRNNIIFSAEAGADGLFLCLGEDNSILSRLSFSNRHAGYMLDFRLSPRNASLAKALVLGDRSSLSDVLTRNFARIGISHILALSGMHLALIIGIYLFFAKRLIKNRVLLRLSVLPITIFILLFTGISASLLRASLMLIISYIGLIMKRKPDSITTLFFILFIILAADPYSVFDVGLILSFSSVFGIVLLMPYFASLKFYVLRRLHGGFVVGVVLPFIYDSFTLSFSACAFTLPAMLFFFDFASVIGIFSTFAFTPLIVAYIIISLLIFVFYKSPFACDLLSRAASAVYEVIEWLSGRLSELDGICVSCNDPLFWVAFCLILFALIFAVLKNSLRSHFAVLVLSAHIAFVIFVAIASFIRPDNHDINFVSLDTDCGLITATESGCVAVDLSDGGRDSAEMIADGVFGSLCTELDTLVLSNYGSKHTLMLKHLNSFVPIRKVLLPEPISESENRYYLNMKAFAEQNGIEIEAFEQGERLNLACGGIDVINLRKSPTSKASTAVNVSFNGRTYLLLDENYSEASGEVKNFARLADVVYFPSGSSFVEKLHLRRDSLVISY